MKVLPNNVFDLTVTSPPYNIGKAYEHPLPLDDYIEWCGSWMSEIFRLSGPLSAFWLNLGYISLQGRARAIPLPYLLWEKCPFHLIQ